MDTLMIVFFPFIVALLVFAAFTSRRANCPDCGERLPILISPFAKTRRMWRAGGYLCTRCGCETNLAGQKITADMPVASPQRHLAILAVLLLVGVGLVAGGLMVRRAPVAPPMAAAPPIAPVVALAPNK